jgi:hypothetical protein
MKTRCILEFPTTLIPSPNPASPTVACACHIFARMSFSTLDGSSTLSGYGSEFPSVCRWPPSTTSTWPVMKDAAGLKRYTPAPAMSRTSPRRPTGRLESIRTDVPLASLPGRGLLVGNGRRRYEGRTRKAVHAFGARDRPGCDHVRAHAVRALFDRQDSRRRIHGRLRGGHVHLVGLACIHAHVNGARVPGKAGSDGPR